MSKYTTELRFICETSAGLTESKGFNNINTILEQCRTKIFDFDFPIFDEAYRPILEKKILKHYYTREIATETVGLWKHFLDMRLNEIMPYYNKMYQSELFEFNPLYDVDLTTDYHKTGENDGTSNSSNTGNITDVGGGSRVRTDDLQQNSTDSGQETDNGGVVNKNTRRDYYSDTPQGDITGVESENYLTTYRKTVDDGTGSTTNNTKTFGKINDITNTGTQSTILTDNNTRTLNTKVDTTDNLTTTEDYLHHVKGKTAGASYSKLIKEYREIFLNIDMLIIEELSDLFFGLW